jgi:hypothetical protein
VKTWTDDLTGSITGPVFKTMGDSVMRYIAAMVQNVVVLNAMISGLCRDEAAVG